MKILHLIYTHGISGAEKYLKHLLPGLKAYGIDCDLVVVCPKKASGILTGYCNELNNMGVKTTLLQTSRAEIFLTAKKVNRYLKEHNISILHAHLLNSDLIAALVKSFFYPGLYFISSKHGYQEKLLQQYEAGMQLRPRGLYYQITKYTLRKIDQNLAVSNGIAELFVNIGLSKTKYPFIHHGIAVEAFDKEAYRQECKTTDPQLIIVGRIELFKGHRFLIEALHAVIEAFPGTKLLVLGDGSEKINCMAQVARLGLQNHVAFLGFKSHPYSYISHSDIIILPSLFEPFGLVYIEALALKTPVVAFNTPAANEIIENNVTGLLVDKGDCKALAEKILYLLRNPAESNKIAERAYAKYLSHFTTGVMIQKTAEWYLTLEKNRVNAG